MKSFWKGFFDSFDFSLTHRMRKPEIKQVTWYHKGNWWDHPIYHDKGRK